MTVPSSHPILSQLQDSPSPISQVKALKDLKNEVIGHEYVKELWIGRGILAPLAHILRSHKSNGKSKEGSLHASQFAREDLDSWSSEDEARLQAIIVVGSLAYGQSRLCLRTLMRTSSPDIMLAQFRRARFHPTHLCCVHHSASTVTVAACRNTAEYCAPDPAHPQYNCRF